MNPVGSRERRASSSARSFSCILTQRLEYVLLLFMSEPADMHARHAAVLARLTALALELAERVQAEAVAAEGAEALDRLSQAFHRVARSVRLSVALEAKLARDAQAEAQDQAEEADAPPERRRREIEYHIIDPSKTTLAVRRLIRDPETGEFSEREDEDWVEGRPPAGSTSAWRLRQAAAEAALEQEALLERRVAALKAELAGVEQALAPRGAGAAPVGSADSS